LNIINDPAFRTIMVMELQQSSLKQNSASEYNTPLDKFNKAVPDILNSYSGNVVKRVEDHFLVSFNSVSNAIHAAIDIHALFKHFTGEVKSERIHLKTGLSAGVPVTGNKQIFEDTIKSAERMCTHVIGEIIVSPEVRDLYNSENIKPVIEGKTIIARTHADETFLTLLMDYTEKNWDNVNLKADDFCKPVGCSKSQLYRRMISLTGKSPNTFIKEYRLARALKLLNKKAGNISEIAFETGFSSPSYFSKCFQKRYHHSPSDYLPAKTLQQNPA
jgi:AraC-like DNA-binding protein